jgi:hypothetical protein
MKRYHNAAQVLPTALLRQVQQYCHGILWVPRPTSKGQMNRLRVLSLKSQGVGTAEIARQLRISDRAVRKILAMDKERASTVVPDHIYETRQYRHIGADEEGGEKPPSRR